jgi:uncharacterized protein (TIGR02246 family)
MNITSEKTDIEKLMALYGEAVNASDISKSLALYTNDGSLMPQGASVATGQQQLRHAYEDLFKAFQLNVEYFTDEVIVNGDFAYARTHSKGSTVIRATGATVPVDNKEIFGLNKGNGGWKISHYIFNNNTIK